MSLHSTLRATLVAGVAFAAACGGDKSAPQAETSTPAASAEATAMPSVSILEPQDGATLDGDSITVRLSATGVTIVPAGDTTAGTGHHHLYLDEDLGDPTVAIPVVPGHVIHMGTGVSEYTLTDVPAGEHRLIAVVADGMHVPLQPWVTDTIHFTVR